MESPLHFSTRMHLIVRKIGDVTLSVATVVLLAMFVVFVAGHLGTVGY